MMTSVILYGLKLLADYNSGRLIAHHGQNLWWVNPKTTPRPAFSHCLPIGLENRPYHFGSQLQVYVDAIKENIEMFKKEENEITKDSSEACSQRPLLLVAFHPKGRIPDRHKALMEIGFQFHRRGAPQIDTFYNFTALNHKQWLEAITLHRFTMAPFGHGNLLYLNIF